MITPAVRFGLSLTTAHPQTADPQQCVRDLLERVQTARDLGFHSVWVGDHHVTPHHYLQNIPMIARISAVSGHMQLAHCSCCRCSILFCSLNRWQHSM